jgi:acyl-CoA hydrolase
MIRTTNFNFLSPFSANKSKKTGTFPLTAFFTLNNNKKKIKNYWQKNKSERGAHYMNSYIIYCAGNELSMPFVQSTFSSHPTQNKINFIQFFILRISKVMFHSCISLSCRFHNRWQILRRGNMCQTNRYHITIQRCHRIFISSASLM